MKPVLKIVLPLLIVCVLFLSGQSFAAAHADYTISWERLLFEELRARYFSPGELRFDSDGNILLLGIGRHNVHNIDNVFYKINTSGADVSLDNISHKPTSNEETEVTGSYVPTSDGGYMRERTTSTERFMEKLNSQMVVEFSVSLQKDLGLPPQSDNAPGSRIRGFVEVEDGYVFYGTAGIGKAVRYAGLWDTADPWYFKIGLDGKLLWDKVIGEDEPASIVAAAKGPDKSLLMVRKGGNEDIRFLKIDSQGNLAKEKKDAGRYVSMAYTPGGDCLLLTVTYEDASYKDGNRNILQSNSIYHVTKIDKDLQTIWQQSFYGTKYDRHLQFRNDMHGITILANGNFIVFGFYEKPRPVGVWGNYPAQGYFKIFDSRGNFLGEKFITPDQSQRYSLTSMQEKNGDLYFLGYGGADEYAWLGELKAKKDQQQTPAPAPAGGAAVSVDVDIYIDGQKQYFSDPPVNVQGRTLLPMRALFQALGADVEWEGATSTAFGSRDGIQVRIPIGSRNPTINGNPFTIDVPAQLIRGRTYIPLRFVGEALGDEVEWDGATSSVIITKTQGFNLLRKR